MMQTLRFSLSLAPFAWLRQPRAGALSLALAASLWVSLLASLTGCTSLAGFKKPTLQVAEVRVAGFDREAAQLTLLLKVDNPNASELTLTDMKAELFLAETLAAEATSAQPRITLPANTTVMVPMKITMPFKTLPVVLQKSLIAVVSGGLPYRIAGSVVTQNGLTVLPFTHSGELLGMR